MEESKKENNSADTEFAVIEKENGDDKNISNDDADIIDKDPDIQKGDTYRIYDYCKSNPTFTVAFLSAIAALVSFSLNLFVFVINLSLQKMQGLSFYLNSSGTEWYNFAILSLVMSVTMSFYSFVAADVGKTLNHNTIMGRYVKEYARFAITLSQANRKTIKAIKKRMKRAYDNSQATITEERSEITAEEKNGEKRLDLVKRIISLQQRTKSINRRIIAKALSRLILPMMLYSGISFMYLSLITEAGYKLFAPLIIATIINTIIPLFGFVISAKGRRVPKCTIENMDNFYAKMDTYLDREQEPYFDTKLREKGFRAHLSDRSVFAIIRSLLSKIAMICIVIATLLFLIPRITKAYSVIEYDDKLYIVVAKNGNDYALIEADIINDDTLEIHKSIERHLKSEDLVIEKKTFSKVLFDN